MSIDDANSANNGANKAMKISETEATSSMMEKNGFARPSVNIEESPLPATVADWIDRDVPPPAIIARAHWTEGSAPSKDMATTDTPARPAIGVASESSMLSIHGIL